MMELPNKNCINKNVEMMPFKKFIQAKNVVYVEEKIKINGIFREEDGEITKGDIFFAHKLGNLSMKEIYKLYLEWFNLTKTPFEKERFFISVKLEKGDLE
ncbi:MAG TPA: hypothetical protein ENI61_04035 [Ignavibacteria bacterium]|nr:hypothetical protein [Ignavibacteria bacterium]